MTFILCDTAFAEPNFIAPLSSRSHCGDQLIMVGPAPHKKLGKATASHAFVSAATTAPKSPPV